MKTSLFPFGLDVKLSMTDRKAYMAWLQKQVEVVYLESMGLSGQKLTPKERCDMRDCISDPTDGDFTEDDLRAAFLAGMHHGAWKAGQRK